MLDTKTAKFDQTYWVLGLVQVVHSMEETYAELYTYFESMSKALHQHFPWIPIIDISADLFAILNYLMIALMLGSVPSAEKGSHWSFYWMWSWAIIELLNGAFHICAWLFLHHYFPGGVSGPILFLLSVLFIHQLRTASTKKTAQVTQ